MATYNNLTDIPQFTPRGPTNRGTPYFTYKGKRYNEADFRSQFPQQYTDFQNASGNKASIPAGQPGSPFPSALPANSFEDLLNQAKVKMQEARAANEKRYQQGMANTSNQGKLVDSSFDTLRSQIDADNAAFNQDAQGIKSGLDAGYQQAEEALTGYGQFQESEAKREGASREARAAMGANQRGLYNSTILDSLTRREREATDRNVADVRERVAGLRSGLAERRAGATADLGTTLASMNQQGRLRAADVTQKQFAAKYQQLGDRRGFIERRIDEGPDEVTLANLILQNQQALAAEKAAKKSKTSLGETLGQSLLGSVTGGVGTGIGNLIGGLFCDRRLKTKIEPMGEMTHEGHTIKLYSFEYTHFAIMNKYGHEGVFVGPMADEVQLAMPHAVKRDEGGFFKIVDKALGPKVLV